jgi:prepilin-type N-terminal cleavage/methylation domain-containing protein
MRARAGFTFIELSISIAILATLLGVIGMVQVRGQKAARAIQNGSDVERRADRAIQQVMRELNGVGVHTLVPDPVTALGADTLTFQTPAAVSALGVVTWAAPMRFALQMDDGEADNGLDDDGDGLIDERRLTLTRNIGTISERTSVLCHGVAAWLEDETGGNGLDDNGNGLVDERGFSVRRTGDLLTVRLTVQAPADEGRVVTWTTTTALVIHN